METSWFRSCFTSGLRLSGLAIAWLVTSASVNAVVTTEKTPIANALPIEQRCEAEIEMHSQQLFVGYAREMTKLAKLFQEKADLDNLLLVKTEQDRFGKEKSITRKNVANAPPELQQLQVQCLDLLESARENTARRYFSAADSLKKKYTREGDIPKAVACKADVGRLLTKYPFLAEAPAVTKKMDLPSKAVSQETAITPVAEDAIVKVEDLYEDYVKDATIANKKYQGRKFSIRGEINRFYSGSGARDFGVSLKVPGAAWRIECQCSYRGEVGGEGVIVIKNDMVSVDVTIKKAPYAMGQTFCSGKSEHKVTGLLWMGDTRTFTGQCRGVIGGRILFENCIWSEAKK